MRKRMLRSVFVAVFSAVVAFGTLSGLSAGKSDVRADSIWSVVAPHAASADDAGTVYRPNDSIWS